MSHLSIFTAKMVQIVVALQFWILALKFEYIHFENRHSSQRSQWCKMRLFKAIFKHCELIFKFDMNIIASCDVDQPVQLQFRSMHLLIIFASLCQVHVLLLSFTCGGRKLSIYPLDITSSLSPGISFQDLDYLEEILVIVLNHKVGIDRFVPDLTDIICLVETVFGAEKRERETCQHKMYLAVLWTYDKKELLMLIWEMAIVFHESDHLTLHKKERLYVATKSQWQKKIQMLCYEMVSKFRFIKF